MKRIPLLPLSLFFLAGIVLISFGFFLYLLSELPPLETLKQYNPSLTTKVLDRHGELLGEFYEEQREIVPLSSLPPYVISAFLSAEDDRFYEHKGVDFRGILRAFFMNLLHGEIVQGGSTITQQVAKTFFLTPEKKLIRKMKEILLALKLEKNFTKDEILFLYLNQIYFGRGAYGIGRAAYVYFGKPPQKLTLGEAAILAGLPPAPNRYAPHRDPFRARGRMEYVLEQMWKKGKITRKEYEEALKEEIPISANISPYWSAPYALDMVRSFLLSRFPQEFVTKGGGYVYTTFDRDLLMYAQKVVQRGAREVDLRRGYKGPIRNLSEEEIGYFRSITLYNQRNLLEERGYKGVVAYVGEKPKKLFENWFPDPVTSWFPEDTLFMGVVTGFSPKQDVAYVDLGFLTGRITPLGVRWISPVKTVSRILRKGDLIWVKKEEFPTSQEDQKLYKSYSLPHEVEGSLLLQVEPERKTQSALLSALPETGELIVAVGGTDYRTSQFNRATQAIRQPGSAFKAVVYTCALENGFTPVSTVADNPYVYQNLEENFQWKPKNYEEKFFGDIPLFLALALSRNVVTIQLAQMIGIDAILSCSKRLGIQQELPRNFSIALGSQGITPLELLTVYATLHNLGKRPEFFFVREVISSRGTRLYYRDPPPVRTPPLIPYHPYTKTPPPSQESSLYSIPDPPKKYEETITSFPQVISPETAFLMTFMLTQVVERGTGYKAKVLKRKIAGKTGTTDNYGDAWFVGYVPGLVTLVWTGNDTSEPLNEGETGARASLPTWISFMSYALEGKETGDFPAPPELQWYPVNPRTGYLAGPLSTQVVYVPLPPGKEPLKPKTPFEEGLTPLVDPFSLPEKNWEEP